MPDFPDKLTTEILLDAHIDLQPPESIGATPFGERAVFVVAGGTFEGPKLRGTVRPGGGDWYLRRTDGAGELDVPATLETDDGALVYLSYHGVLDVSDDIVRRVISAGEDVPASDYYFRTTPRFETGAAQYAWLNKLVTVAYGRIGRNKVSYRIFAVC